MGSVKLKRIAILGSTGTIGLNTLDVISTYKDRFSIVGLTTNFNTELLESQVKRFAPKVVCVASDKHFISPRKKTKVVYGLEGVCEVAKHPDVDIVVVAITGSVSLRPILEAIRSGKQIALASKEALVSAGQIIMGEVRKRGVRLIPVDSEHSAIFQCLDGRDIRCLHRIYLTATGGPLRDVAEERFDIFEPEEVISHPKWKMGKKISVDSATLMNKGLEMIEAMWLFSVELEKIQIVIHPDAIIHSMVEFVDGSILAQLSVPDMRLPIQYALSYPERLAQRFNLHLDFSKISRLSFEPPDTNRFPCLRLAFCAGKDGGTYPAVLNASNEVAVWKYLDRRLKFTQIPSLIEKVLSRHRGVRKPTLKQIMDADRWAREEATSLV